MTAEGKMTVIADSMRFNHLRIRFHQRTTIEGAIQDYEHWQESNDNCT
jgi:hypothetical protein